VQGTVDFNEVWDCCPPDAFDESKYPIEVPGFKEAFDAIRPILSALGQKILVSLGLMLNLDDPDFFLKAHPQLENPLVQGNIDGFRSYYCMPVDSAATVESELETHRLSAHCHFGTIMFSFQNSSEGFEVQNRETNEWVSVSPIKGTILVCPGLALENWSGGQILAVVRLKLVSYFERKYLCLDWTHHSHAVHNAIKKTMKKNYEVFPYVNVPSIFKVQKTNLTLTELIQITDIYSKKIYITDIYIS
jgi:hypothetical protein